MCVYIYILYIYAYYIYICILSTTKWETQGVYWWIRWKRTIKQFKVVCTCVIYVVQSQPQWAGWDAVSWYPQKLIHPIPSRYTLNVPINRSSFTSSGPPKTSPDARYAGPNIAPRTAQRGLHSRGGTFFYQRSTKTHSDLSATVDFGASTQLKHDRKWISKYLTNQVL